MILVEDDRTALEVAVCSRDWEGAHVLVRELGQDINTVLKGVAIQRAELVRY